tara:strand:- start:1465 stop:1794 length:330 start_codon:yes stop_codon:yes gene_type:complete
MLRDVKSTQRLTRLLSFRVDGTGTASILEGSQQATLVDNGTGDYTLTFAVPFVRVPVCSGNAIGSTAAIINVAVVSISAVQIKAFDAAGAAVDVDFHLSVLGFDSADQT